MRKISLDTTFKFWGLMLFWVLLGCVTCQAGFDARADIENQVVATVDGENIFESDVIKRVKINKILGIPLTSSKAALKALVEDELVMSTSKKFNFSVTTAEGQAALKAFEESRKWPAGTFYKKAAAEELSKEDIDLYFLQETLVQRFLQAFALAQAQVSEQELNKAYDDIVNLNGKSTFQLQQIFIPGSGQSAQNIASKVYKLLKKGGNFKVLAGKYSGDSYSKQQGAEIGWLQEDQLPPEVKDALVKLKIGEFTAPMKVEGGYALYKLVNQKMIIYFDVNDAKTSTQLKNLLRQKIMSEKLHSVIANYLSSLKSNAIITYH